MERNTYTDGPERLLAALALTTCNACDGRPMRPGCAPGYCIPCELEGRPPTAGYAVPIGGGWAFVCAACAPTCTDEDQSGWEPTDGPLAGMICELCPAQQVPTDPTAQP